MESRRWAGPFGAAGAKRFDVIGKAVNTNRRP
jgi:hypothetical protein